MMDAANKGITKWPINSGLDNVKMSWGHDEYLYQIVKDYLPQEALYMIRYHSFYPWHTNECYFEFMNETDHEILKNVRYLKE